MTSNKLNAALELASALVRFAPNQNGGTQAEPTGAFPVHDVARYQPHRVRWAIDRRIWHRAFATTGCAADHI